MSRTYRAATRGSKLALWQTEHVAGLLGIDVEPVVISTKGDQRRDVPIEAIRGQGVFVKEVQAAVLDGRADFAVHSAKDLPSTEADGLVIAAIPERGDPRDALIGSTLDGLCEGALVGTGSVRRAAQLAAMRPDLRFAGLRGNVDTRLAKLGDYDAIVMAVAPLVRLQMDANWHALDPAEFVPQVGQGALAVECRSDDEGLRGMLGAIEHVESRRAVDAERSYLARLGGGCDLPVGAYATIDSGEVVLDVLIAALDGTRVVRRSARSADGVALGVELANAVLADGGADLLAFRNR